MQPEVVSRETVSMATSLGVSRETLDRLITLVTMLLRWNATINLVSSSEVELVWSRHILDCLQLLPSLPKGLETAIDLGSGAGFPGLVLALASGVHFDLIEADKRKAAFLAEAARKTRSPVTVHACRIESYSASTAPLVTSRALAPLDQLLTFAFPLLTQGGSCLFLKGRQVREEITIAKASWTMRLDIVASLTNPTSVILRVSDLARKI